MIPENYVQRVIQFAQQGYDRDRFPDLRHRLGQRGLSHRLRPELEQLGAHPQRVPRAGARADGEWNLIRRTDGKVAKTLKARELWDEIAYAAWACADPGVQFDTTINEWHTCPASGRINASNPCSEYMFLDDTACNLASLNLLAVPRATTGASTSTASSTRSGCGPIVLEISVLMAQFPSREIARLSYEFRTLGLGYANLGALLMALGPALRQRGRPRALRRHHRDHDRRRLRHLGRDGRRAGRLPRLSPRTARPCCGSSATTAARRPWRDRRL